MFEGGLFFYVLEQFGDEEVEDVEGVVAGVACAYF